MALSEGIQWTNKSVLRLAAGGNPVAVIEKQNQSDSALRIEMWPESHLERLLASRPAIIAEFSLR